MKGFVREIFAENYLYGQKCILHLNPQTHKTLN